MHQNEVVERLQLDALWSRHGNELLMMIIIVIMMRPLFWLNQSTGRVNFPFHICYLCPPSLVRQFGIGCQYTTTGLADISILVRYFSVSFGRA